MSNTAIYFGHLPCALHAVPGDAVAVAHAEDITATESGRLATLEQRVRLESLFSI